MVIVQVRRRADVCYPSGMGEPYMSGLTPSNFNALLAMIDAAHDTTGGKKHLLSGIAHELVRQGRKVYFSTRSLLVQELLAAKRDLKLSRFIRKLSRYEVIVIDDLGYVQQSREEMEVLFTLLAERYERGSVMITSNLPFSKWEAIFKDPMTTAAAIDRLVYHCIILELNIPSYRMEQAKKNRPHPPDGSDTRASPEVPEVPAA